MYRIGILTFHRSINNGAVLQSYSLSKRVASDFPNCSVEIIDYNMLSVCKHYDYSLSGYFKSCNGSLSAILKKIIMLVKSPLFLKKMRARSKAFSECVDKYLPLSSKKITSDDLSVFNETIKNDYDLIIVGSDAIWNCTLRKFPNAYFLIDTNNVRKMSYAASNYGFNYKQFSEGQRKLLKTNFDTFDYIGVRDECTERFIKETETALPVHHNCDPTVFLNLDEIPTDLKSIESKLIKSGWNKNIRLIGVMGDRLLLNIAKKIFGSMYKYIALYEPIKGADIDISGLSPFEWSRIFSLFDITFTTYFHGTLLSLKNATPVICVNYLSEYSKVYETKHRDLLRRLNMEDCYFLIDRNDYSYEQIKNKAHSLVNGGFDRDKLRDSLLNEARYYDSFKFKLEEVIDENNSHN